MERVSAHLLNSKVLRSPDEITVFHTITFGHCTLKSTKLLNHYVWIHKFVFFFKIACKSKTLGSLYGHALLILNKSSKSKDHVVHEQMFEDTASSKCPVSIESV